MQDLAETSPRPFFGRVERIWIGSRVWLWVAGAVGLGLAAGYQIGRGANAFLLAAAFGLVGLLLVALLYERFPIYALIVILSLTTVLKVDFIPSTLLIIPGALAVFRLLLAVGLEKRRLHFSAIQGMGLLLGIWASIATTAVGSLGESRPYWLVILLLLLLPNALTRREHLLRACWMFLLPLGGMGYYVLTSRLLALLNTPAATMNRLHLASLATGDKNIVGMWLTLGIPFAYYLYVYERKPANRFWLVLSGVGMLAGAIATISIGVSIGLSVMVALIVWLQPKVSSRLRMLVAGGALLLLIFNGPIADRLATQDLTSLDSSWGSYRGEIWNASYHTILDYPLFGIGLVQERRIVMLKYINSAFFQSWYDHGVTIMPHNILLSVGLETGLPGLVIYMGLLAAVFGTIWKLKRRFQDGQDELMRTFAHLLLVAMLTGWVQAMGLTVHLDKLIWFMLTAPLALANIVRLEDEARGGLRKPVGQEKNEP